MSAPLSFCLACARFSPGDRQGELLAVFATAPYFAVYHVAAVLYARRELHMACVLLGLLFISWLSSAIKKQLQQPRPAATCTLLGNCNKFGMPSSHSAVMAFAATTSLLLYLHRQTTTTSSSEGSAAKGRTPAAARHRGGGSSSSSNACSMSLVDRLARAVQLLEVQLLAGLTLAVAYGRIYLGYHTHGQVAAGLALGAAVAVVWWRLTVGACQRFGTALLRLAPLRALHFRNTLGCPDVHAAEATLFAGIATAQHVD